MLDNLDHEPLLDEFDADMKRMCRTGEFFAGLAVVLVAALVGLAWLVIL